LQGLYLPAGDFFVADFRKIYYFCDAKKQKVAHLLTLTILSGVIKMSA
jgi:hypothetical protein